MERKDYLVNGGDISRKNGMLGGRPKGSQNVSTLLKKLLAGFDTDKEYGNPIAKELIKMAFGKNPETDKPYSENVKLKALEQIMERVEGKITQPLSHEGSLTHNIEGDLNMKWEIVDNDKSANDN